MQIVDFISQPEIDNFLDYVAGSSVTEARMLARQEIEDLWLLVRDEFEEKGIPRNEAGLGDAINFLVDTYVEQRRYATGERKHRVSQKQKFYRRSR